MNPRTQEEFFPRKTRKRTKNFNAKDARGAKDAIDCRIRKIPKSWLLEAGGSFIRCLLPAVRCPLFFSLTAKGNF